MKIFLLLYLLSSVYISFSRTHSNTLPSPQPQLLSRGSSCNGHPAFCTRSYGNITFIGTHNSPFSTPSSPFSNQHLPVLTQLTAGIRLLQAQTRLNNHILHLCHTNCSYLDVGPAEDFFKTVADWLTAHTNEVLTILLGNADLVPVSGFRSPLESSGLARYAFHPPKYPMALVDWPTLGELIASNQRAIIFLDFNANQGNVPYVLDEFSQMWETPFDPVDRNFPCTVDRPPGLGQKDARDRLFLSNHNLNSQLLISGKEVLVPDTMDLGVTNGVSGTGSLGLAVQNCAEIWGRPPNFLLVDFYDVGNGSVFDVAAMANGVDYVPSATAGEAGTSVSVASAATGTMAVGTIAMGGSGAVVTTGALGGVATASGAATAGTAASSRACIGILAFVEWDWLSIALVELFWIL